ELEIELVSGSPLALVDVAGRLIGKHGLWLDIRSKAERGDRLARGIVEVPAIKSGDVALSEKVSVQEARAAVLASCLQQVLANASEIAAGLGGPEHVHQLRVGLRRLRSAQRLFAGGSHDSHGDESGGQGAAAQPKAGASAAELFRSLGAARDRDVLVATLVPALQAAHAPTLELPPAAQAVDPAALLRGREANLALLELLSLSLEAAEPPGPAADPAAQALPPPLLRPLAAQQLKRWHRSIARDAARFTELDDAARHRLRKRLKRLRYSVEFVASLFKRKRVAAYLGCLRPAQDALGFYNDLAIGEAAYRALLEQDAHAWFALGWIAARRAELLGEAQLSLDALARAERFWK
ncbi:MAG TPA: CHAD domain-containing protein, partial [Methylibium sp.]